MVAHSALLVGVSALLASTCFSFQPSTSLLPKARDVSLQSGHKTKSFSPIYRSFGMYAAPSGVDVDQDAILNVIGPDNLDDLTAEDSRLVSALIKLGQSHLFAHWPKLAEDEREEKRQQLDQLHQLDAGYPGGLKHYITKSRDLLMKSAQGVNPFDGYEPHIPSGEILNFGSLGFERTEERGLDEVAKTAFVLVAGGLGERLGFSGVKLSLPLESETGQTYLQLYAQYILAVQSRARKLRNDPSITLPLVIMTSDDTDGPTRQLLRSHNSFGLTGKVCGGARDQVTVVKQEKVAALTNSEAEIATGAGDGKPYKVNTKPHGHGDVHVLLHRAGIAHEWDRFGYEWAFFLQDTNALVINSILPALGTSALHHFHMNSVCIPRQAGEAAGAIVRLVRSEGSSRGGIEEEREEGMGREITINVEYNQLDPLLRSTAKYADGDVNDPATAFSPFPGNANNLVFHIPTYATVLSGRDGGMVDEFVNPKYKDKEKKEFKKPTRLECMMQDFPKLMSKEARRSATSTGSFAGDDNDNDDNDAGYGGGGGGGISSWSPRVGFTSLDRWLSFSPAKNSLEAGQDLVKGGNDAATVSTAEFDFYKSCWEKLKRYGNFHLVGDSDNGDNNDKAAPAPAPAPAPATVEVAGVPLPNVPRILLSPSFSVTSREIGAKTIDYSQRKDSPTNQHRITRRSTLVLDGEGIKLRGLDLDGALVVRAGAGVQVLLDNVVVRNGGTKIVPVAEGDENVPESTQIRGYVIRPASEVEGNGGGGGDSSVLVVDIQEEGNYVVTSASDGGGDSDSGGKVEVTRVDYDVMTVTPEKAEVMAASGREL